MIPNPNPELHTDLFEELPSFEAMVDADAAQLASDEAGLELPATAGTMTAAECQ